MDPFADRSWRFWLHAWHWLEPLLHHHADTGDEEPLDLAVAFIEDWLLRHPLGASGRSEFAWYDMAVGSRAAILGYVVRAGREAGLRDEVQRLLERGAVEHGWWLADPRNYTAAHNHGLYEDAGLGILALQMPGGRDADLWWGIARRRFRDNVSATVSTRDAIHLEHSPAYHASVTALIDRLRGVLGLEDLAGLVDRMREQTPWFVFPDERFVQLGDTDLVAPPGWVSARGRPDGLMFAPEAGFAAVVSGEEQLVVACGHHGRAHKHADELTFSWFAAGRRVAVDAGRFAYEYDDPGRQFAESQRAHNVLGFVDREAWGVRGRRPFGSGLRWAGSADGWFVIRGDNPAIRDEGLYHERVWLYRPGVALFVLDLTCDERFSGAGLRRYLHLGSGLRAERVTAGDWRIGEDGKTATAWVSELSPQTVVTRVVRGQTDPEVQGFTFPASRVWQENEAMEFDSGAAGPPLCLGLAPSRERAELRLDWVEGGPGQVVAVQLRIDDQAWVLQVPRAGGDGLLVTGPR
ncbi:MAG: heparinase II/III domain-containing protein [Planctomycetota bacterium]